MNKQDYLKELSLFADLDSVPKVLSEGENFSVKFTSGGVSVSIKLPKDGGGVVREKRGDMNFTHSSYKSLLASANFGNLRRLAEAQKALIKSESPYIIDERAHLPIVGSLHLNISDDTNGGGDLLKDISAWLVSGQGNESSPPATRALVLDGPAGIGKTHLIKKLAFKSASLYGPGSAPPILHVQSRGRKLTNLNDVLAGTLQALRVSLTFDQVPVMVRHGLLQVAFDGFDELADPNGYETAWGSLRDFVEDLSGQGLIVLAGRDTFINAQSIRRSVLLLNSESTVAAHLRPLDPQEAKHWLESKKSSASKIKQMESFGFFEENSYALRPFFLAKISEFTKDGKAFNQFADAPLTTLVNAMLQREGALASRKISGVDFSMIYRELLMEVARDMADSEVDSVEVSTLNLIAEMIFGKYLAGDDLAVSIHRVSSISLLEGDAKSGTRAFPHTEVMSYFLSMAYANLLVEGDYPKSIRRGILGRDFLLTFNEVLAAEGAEIATKFCAAAQNVLDRRLLDGRGGRNVASLLLAALDKDLVSFDYRISNQQIDEALVRGAMPTGSIVSVEFSTLDVRGADLSSAKFNECSVVKLIADGATKLPIGFPRPLQLTVDQDGTAIDVDQDEIPVWIEQHTISPEVSSSGRHWALFERICRAMVRQFSIRAAGDDPGARLLSREEWREIKRVLDEEGVLQVRENVAARGPKADFYRIENAREYLIPSGHSKEGARVIARIKALDIQA